MTLLDASSDRLAARGAATLLGSLAPRWRWPCLALALLSPGVAFAQGGDDLRAASEPDQVLAARPIGLEKLPSRRGVAVASADGDLLVVHDASTQAQPHAMTRVIAASTMFQLDGIVFDREPEASMRVEHVAQGPQQTLWAVGRSLLVHKRAGLPWEAVELGPVDEEACKARRRFEGPCQLVVPLTEERAVVLRPVFEQPKGQGRVLSTQLIAVQSGQPKPLARVSLPNIVMGPAVQDGQGGFWTMVQRVQLGVNYKPLRGYMRYTAQGDWLMWSDSQEAIPGIKLMGQAALLIDPQPGKMAPDGQGGFITIGRDRKIYRVDAQGVPSRVSAQQPACHYCHPLSVAYDPITREVHLLMAKWRGGEASARVLEEPLRWMRFGAQGALEDSELVPLPEPFARQGVSLYDQLQLHVAARQVWLVGPTLLMHRDKREWSWLDEPSRVNAYIQSLVAQGKTVPGDPEEPLQGPPSMALKYTGLSAMAALTVGGLVGAGVWAPEGRGAELFVPWLFGTLAAYYPGQLVFPHVIDSGDPTALRWSCLGAGALGLPLLTGGTTWLMGEYYETQQGRGEFNGRSLLGAMGGAAVGTAGALLLARLVYGADPKTEEWIVNALASSLIASAATWGYMWTEPR